MTFDVGLPSPAKPKSNVLIKLVNATVKEFQTYNKPKTSEVITFSFANLNWYFKKFLIKTSFPLLSNTEFMKAFSGSLPVYLSGWNIIWVCLKAF